MFTALGTRDCMCLKSYTKAVVAPEEAGNLITREQEESRPRRWTPWDFYFGKLCMVVNGESFLV